jgi:hypothetical protein
MKQKEKELEKERIREEKEKEKEKKEYERQREKEEKEIEREKNREKEKERQMKENEKKKEKDNEKREEHLKAKEEIEREKEKMEKMKLRNKEEKMKQREKEKEEKEKLKEKEKDERNKREEKIKKEREEKERQKQMEKEEKYKLKEERERQKQREREEREKQKQREKEEREREKQRLREERKRYNERFQNASKLLRLNNGRNITKAVTQPKYRDSGKSRQQGLYYQRLAYDSNRLYHRKRRHSHKRIQPKNRIPRIEPAKKLGKTTLKIIKPKRYDEDESETEQQGDFEEKLMKFPRFRAKYGKNYVLKKNKFVNLNTYLSDSLNKNFGDYQRPREIENKMGNTKKTNLTISEVDEEKTLANKTLRRGRLSQIKPKGRVNTQANLNKKMREILGKQYKILVDDPLNPYGTFWPSNFLKAGYDAGFEYEDFQSGVPVLKLRNLGKKQLPPIKKKGLNFNETTVYTPNKNTSGKHLYPVTSAKKKLHEELMDNRPSKSQNFKNNEENVKLKGITEENEIIYENLQ